MVRWTSNTNEKEKIHADFCFGDPFVSIFLSFKLYCYILDKKHKELGAKFVPQTDVLGTGLVFNENQRKAIQKALMSSFSLIQGPPGSLWNKHNFLLFFILIPFIKNILFTLYILMRFEIQ